MIGRFLTITIATSVTALALAGAIGLMALDLLGATFLQKLFFVAKQPRSEPVVAKELQGTKDITFFKTVKVDGRPFSITMGISFATPEDLASGKQQSRWCYTMIKPKNGGVPRQIELAKQDGANPPRYNDLTGYPPEELAALGETIESLATIARKHCVFTKEPGGPGTMARRLTTIVLKGEMPEGES